MKDSYKDIIHSHTGEIRKYAAEQTFYNEQQIEELQSLVAEHIGLKGRLCEYTESVEKTFVAVPDSTKRPKLSRNKKESRHKTKKKRKCAVRNSVITSFIKKAVPGNLRMLYFGRLDVDPKDYSDLPQPFTTYDIDMDTFLELTKIHRQMIYSNGYKWFALDVLDYMEKNL